MAWNRSARERLRESQGLFRGIEANLIEPAELEQLRGEFLETWLAVAIPAGNVAKAEFNVFGILTVLELGDVGEPVVLSPLIGAVREISEREGHVVNRIEVPEKDKIPARQALERMLALT